jgi:uncharacterized delta-60 repeat protein
MREKVQIFFLLFVLLLLQSSFITARVQEEWVARYNGPGNDGDQARAIALDAEGNVYVTGESIGVGTDLDYATIKYDSDGKEVWVARYNGPANGRDEARAIALDAEGYVYVTGLSFGVGTNLDYATIKYDPEGKEVWVARYNGPANGQDEGKAIAVDSEGNVYVTGWSLGLGAGGEYATIKYDSDGNEVWVARYTGPGNGGDEATALAIDSEGNVYVTGSSPGIDTGNDIATIKYDSDGNEVWVARYAHFGNLPDVGWAIAADSEGNVYVTGTSQDPVTNNDYVTIKYDRDGNEVWIARYNGPANSRDAAFAIALDAEGNVYVTGSSYGRTRSGGIAPDYATIKYDSDGNEVWVARYTGPANVGDEAAAIALDAEGNVYVTGRSVGVGTSLDYATVKYDTKGNEVWVARYNGPGNSSDVAWAIAVDLEANVYVTGGSWGLGTNNDYATIKYSQK